MNQTSHLSAPQYFRNKHLFQPVPGEDGTTVHGEFSLKYVTDAAVS